MKRKLASLKRITNLAPIAGADKIEVATIDNGWKCVVKKGEFKNGDLGVYFEIDSFLPETPVFDFLKKSGTKKMGEERGYRIKTVKLRGQISQGLFIPVETFKKELEGVKLEEGMDLTEKLNVKKYEAPIPASLSGEVFGGVPGWIRKTDQERCQNIWGLYSRDYLEEEGEKESQVNPIKDLEFEATVKLDGSSMTCFIVDPKRFETRNIKSMIEKDPDLDFYYGVCGRNYELKPSEKNTYHKVSDRDIKERLVEYHLKTGKNIAVQGELMGPGIQGNREKLKNHEFFCYDIWSIDEQRYMTKDEKKEIIDFLGIKTVPFIENIKVFKRFKSIEELLTYAEGESLNHNVREGVVFKSNTLVNGETVSFKAISNKFLLKYE